MKKDATLNLKLIPSQQQRAVLATIIALVITTIMTSALWFWFIKPINQQQFNQQVINNAKDYRHRIQQHMNQLHNALARIAENIPVSTFAQDQHQLEQWVAEQQSYWLSQLPNVNNVTLLAHTAIQKQARDDEQLSFIAINMVNRLEAGKPTYIEVARIAGKTQSQMHKMVPIHDHQGLLVGVLYATFSISHLQTLFSQDDLSLAHITLKQYIDNESPLPFLSLGKSANTYPPKVFDIPNSYWQLSYSPTEKLFKQTSMDLTWLWLLILLMLLTVYLVSFNFLLPKNELRVSKKTTKINAETWSKAATSDALTDKNVTNNSENPEEKPPTTAPSPDSQSNSGTEIPDSVFRVYDIRGIAHQQITHELMYSIGQAVATEVLMAGDKAMIIGRDARTHSLEFSQCVIGGIVSTGCHVIDIGIVPTPLVNFTTCQHEQTSSGLMITASHNPEEYNGCKIIVKGQTLTDDDIQVLKARIINNNVIHSDDKGSIKEDDFSQAYIDRVVGDIAVIDGWRVVVDAGNGASSELAPRLFQAMKCNVAPLFCQFDGTFPHHSPDPSIPENLVPLIDKVKSEKADIGFALDGDGDRLVAITPKGRILWPDQLLMLFAQDIVARHPGSNVVFDIKSSQLLSQIITEHGGCPIMWKTGHSHIKAKMKETQALLGGEFSGHIFFKERWFGFDDGLYAAARLLEILTLTGQTIDHLLTSLPFTLSTPEIKIAVAEEQKFALIDRLIKEAHFPSGDITTIDGLRVDFDDGWGLIRASNTAPVLTLRFEAKNKHALQKIKADFQQALNHVNLHLPSFA